jgi:hypothetical protein
MNDVYRNALRMAMNATHDPDLSEKTRHEQEAGRARIMQNLRASVVDVGIDELQRRFTRQSVPTGGLHFYDKQNRWTVDVIVHTAAKTTMQLEDELLEFPSEYLIAQIALVV